MLLFFRVWLFYMLSFLIAGINNCICQNTYSGSQAYNNNAYFSQSVNISTGSYRFDYTLINAPGVIQPFTFKLIYQHNRQQGLFGLPVGWFFTLDYIDKKTASINNQQWPIDPLWHDESGYGSGLKYFNSHGSQFSDIGFLQPIPECKRLYYRYVMNFKDGSKKYFSHQGWLIFQLDRFGNSLEYIYNPIAKDLSEARLEKIRTNYQQEYTFSYSPNSITILTPANQKTVIYFHAKGVKKITNALGESIEITYTDTAQNLIQQVATETGLVTKLSYRHIDYQGEGGKGKLPVIDLVEKIDQVQAKTLERTWYDYSSGNNFTGYPLYTLGSTSDSLIDSNDQAFRYPVKVTRDQLIKGQTQFQIKYYYYNYLHLPVEIITTKENQPYIKTTFDYHISPFKYSRSTNYDKPRKVTNWLYQPVKGKYIATDEKTTSYDEFGNKTDEAHFVYDLEGKQKQLIYQIKQDFDTKWFNLPVQSERIDGISHASIKDVYGLSEDHKNQISKQVTYKGSKDDNWQPWKHFEIAHDEIGRELFASVKWAEFNEQPLQCTHKNTSYHLNEDGSSLLVTKTNALGHHEIEQYDLQTGLLSQVTCPKGSTTFFTYDALNRLINIKDGLGERIGFAYSSYDQSGENSVTLKSPLGEQKRTLYDGLGRVIANQDWYQHAWRNLEAYQYDGFHHITHITNALKITTQSHFDPQGRLTSTTDPWGNHKQVNYDDIKRLTLVTLNDHKIIELKALPWLNTLEETHFEMEEGTGKAASKMLLTQKDGFGRLIKRKQTHATQQHPDQLDYSETCHYDAENNPTQCLFEGNDALTLLSQPKHDLFNNTIQVRKQQNNSLPHTSYLLTYNAANQLETIDFDPLDGQSDTIKSFEYDKLGHLAKTHWAGELAVNYLHDERGQLREKSWDNGGVLYKLSQTYDLDGKLLKQADTEGQFIDYQYNQEGLLTDINSNQHDLSLSYDSVDRVVSQEIDHAFTQEFIYQEKDKGMLSKALEAHNVVHYHYGEDRFGNKGRLIEKATQTVFSGNQQTLFDYGATGFIESSTTENRPSGGRIAFHYKTNLLGQLTQKTFSIETQNKHSLSHVIYQYDALNRVIEESHNLHGDKEVLRYRYDANDNLINETLNDHSKDYHYNQRDQLTQIMEEGTQGHHLRYDKAGRLSHFDDLVFNYNHNDELISLFNRSTDTHTALHYLANGLLATKKTKNKESNFSYSKEKQLLGISINSNALHLLRDNKQANLSIQGTTTNLLTADLENISVQTNANEQNFADYLAYGQLTNPSTIAHPLTPGWKGAYYDSDLGCYYFHHRFYNPELKRFITPDKKQTYNRYNFAYANPLSFNDNSGQSVQQVVNYTVGATSTALGIYATYESIALAIIGAILAVPTGGASLSLTTVASVTAALASTASGISLLAAQGAMDTGHQDIGNALSYTSIAFSAMHVVTGLTALAPKLENLLTRMVEWIGKKGALSHFNIGADAYTLYHMGSELYEGEKDLAKIISGWELARHGLHIASKLTTDSFNILETTKSNVASHQLHQLQMHNLQVRSNASDEYLAKQPPQTLTQIPMLSRLQQQTDAFDVTRMLSWQDKIEKINFGAHIHSMSLLPEIIEHPQKNSVRLKNGFQLSSLSDF